MTELLVDAAPPVGADRDAFWSDGDGLLSMLCTGAPVFLEVESREPREPTLAHVGAFVRNLRARFCIEVTNGNPAGRGSWTVPYGRLACVKAMVFPDAEAARLVERALELRNRVKSREKLPHDIVMIALDNVESDVSREKMGEAHALACKSIGEALGWPEDETGPADDLIMEILKKKGRNRR